MPRRDAFSMLRGTSAAPPQNAPAMGNAAADPIDPPAIKPLDFIPSAEPRKKRDRTWEKAHRGQVATYRGIPSATHQIIQHIADNLGVPMDEVARAFLEYSLAAHANGRLPIHPHPKAQRMTLYPDGQPAAGQSSQPWLRNAFSSQRSGKKRKKANEPKPWDSRVSYRLPVSLKQAVKEVADLHTVGVGELVLFLFQYALSAYEHGALRLEAHPKVSGNTLF